MKIDLLKMIKIWRLYVPNINPTTLLILEIGLIIQLMNSLKIIALVQKKIQTINHTTLIMNWLKETSLEESLILEGIQKDKRILIQETYFQIQ